jgi:hypothetical protein
VNPTFGQTDLVIVGANGMVGSYALKDQAVGGATSIGRKVRGISHSILSAIGGLVIQDGGGFMLA